MPRPPPEPSRARTRLVGRDRELQEITALLADPDTRLLTLVGVGGAGKTRLAREVADRSAEAAFAPLDGVSDPALLPTVVADALGIRDSDRRTELDRVVAALRGRRVLLVLDTVEHLPEAARFAVDLLDRCAGLQVLATSRVPLHVRSERRYPVPPLPLPEPSADAEAARRSPAVQLLLERIAEGRADFALDDDTAPGVVELVRRLDGLPLALELAAGRLRQSRSTPDRLGDLLGVGSSAVPQRHRTVRAVLDATCSLLPSDAWKDLRAISAHVGPFDADAAEALAGRPVDLGRLVDACIVQPVGDRYALLALVREHASARRVEAGEEAEVRARWVARAIARAEDTSSARWHLDLEREHENQRAVLDWLLATGDGAAAVRLAAALTRFWYLHGHYHEGRRWLRRALAAAPDAPNRAHALQGAGRLALLQCDYAEARRLLSEAAAAATDAPTRLAALQSLGSVAREQADYDASIAWHTECLLGAGSPTEAARARSFLGFAAWLSGDTARARRELTTAVEAFAALDDAEGTATSRIYLGGVALAEGDLEEARQSCARGLSISRTAGFLEGVAWARNLLGVCDLQRGDLERATDELRTSLRIHLDLGDVWRAASVLEALARVDAERGRYGRAARLLGAAAQVREAIGTPVPPIERPALAALGETLGAMLGPDAATEIASGRHLELEDAAALARADDDDLPAPVWW